jgi:mannose/fructose/N-acetylgalactosamine-specific phosphotransferase system component IIC
MIIPIAIAVVVGSLLWMDREYALQVQISRPIIIAAIVGIIMGNLHAALFVGIALEILGLNAPPVGGYLPYDENFCAVVAIPVACVSAQFLDNLSAAGFSLFLSMPALIVGREIDAHIMRKNENFPLKLEEDWLRNVDWQMVKSLIGVYLKILLSASVCVAILSCIAWRVAPVLPEVMLKVFVYMPAVAVMIGLAGLVIGKRMHSKISWVSAFALGVAAVILWKWYY